MREGVRINRDTLQQIVELPTDKIGIGVKKFMTLTRFTLLHTNVILACDVTLGKSNDIIAVLDSPLELDMKLGRRHWHSYKSTS